MLVQPGLSCVAEQHPSGSGVDEHAGALVMLDLEGEVLSVAAPARTEGLFALAAGPPAGGAVADHPRMRAARPLVFGAGATLENAGHGPHASRRRAIPLRAARGTGGTGRPGSRAGPSAASSCLRSSSARPDRQPAPPRLAAGSSRPREQRAGQPGAGRMHARLRPSGQAHADHCQRRSRESPASRRRHGCRCPRITARTGAARVQAGERSRVQGSAPTWAATAASRRRSGFAWIRHKLGGSAREVWARRCVHDGFVPLRATANILLNRPAGALIHADGRFNGWMPTERPRQPPRASAPPDPRLSPRAPAHVLVPGAPGFRENPLCSCYRQAGAQATAARTSAHPRIVRTAYIYRRSGSASEGLSGPLPATSARTGDSVQSGIRTGTQTSWRTGTAAGSRQGT